MPTTTMSHASASAADSALKFLPDRAIVPSRPAPDRLLRKKVVCELLGDISQSSLWRTCKEFPDLLTPLQLRPGVVCFRESQVLQFIATRPVCDPDNARTRAARKKQAAKVADRKAEAATK